MSIQYQNAFFKSSVLSSEYSIGMMALFYAHFTVFLIFSFLFYCLKIARSKFLVSWTQAARATLPQSHFYWTENAKS